MMPVHHFMSLRLAVTCSNKSSAAAEMGDSGHNRHGQKEGAAVPLSRGMRGELGPCLTQCGQKTGGLGPF